MRKEVLHPGKKLLRYIYNVGDSKDNPLRVRAGISESEWYGFVSGELSVNTSLANRLSTIVPDTDVTYWMTLQQKYDESILNLK